MDGLLVAMVGNGVCVSFYVWSVLMVVVMRGRSRQ